MKPYAVLVTANYTVSGPGTYGVTVSGITIKLANWTTWNDLGSVRVKDLTGDTNPNITVIPWPGGLIDEASLYTLTLPYQAITLTPFINGNTWTIE